jgi:hypothetical protein
MDKDGLITNRGKGGKKAYFYDDLVNCEFLQKAPYALCITNTIYYNFKKGEIAVYNKDKKYKIVEENKIWIYLFNEKWGGSFRIGKKQFRKNFSIKGQLEYDAAIFNL